MASKEKAKVSDQLGLLAPDSLPALSDQQALAHRADIEAAVASFRSRMGPENSPIRAVRHLEARPPRYAPIPAAVEPALRTALETRGIRQLYSHQAEAFDHVAAGRNVVVVTPTASGKTLCYNLPVLNRLLRRPGRPRHVPVPHQGAGRGPASRVAGAPSTTWAPRSAPSPTTATRRRTPARPSASAPTSCSPIPTCCTPGSCRTTPSWAKLFENLRYIVIDELHYYRGVYGSHLANVLRRLKRICEFYGSKPQFICCSATIANPRELAEALTEPPFELVDRNGAPARREVLRLLQPAGGQPAARHPAQLHRTRPRRIGARVHRPRPADAGLRQQPPGDRGAGHLPEGRLRARPAAGARRCAATAAATCRASAARSSGKLRDGEIRAVVATNALELGIDIGSLDAVVMAGYPGTIASTWQRAGRAGRRQRHVARGAGGLQRARSISTSSSTPSTSSTARPSTPTSIPTTSRSC